MLLCHSLGDNKWGQPEGITLAPRGAQAWLVTGSPLCPKMVPRATAWEVASRVAATGGGGCEGLCGGQCPFPGV